MGSSKEFLFYRLWCSLSLWNTFLPNSPFLLLYKTKSFLLFCCHLFIKHLPSALQLLGGTLSIPGTGGEEACPLRCLQEGPRYWRCRSTEVWWPRGNRWSELAGFKAQEPFPILHPPSLPLGCCKGRDPSSNPRKSHVCLRQPWKSHPSMWVFLAPVLVKETCVCVCVCVYKTDPHFCTL